MRITYLKGSFKTSKKKKGNEIAFIAFKLVWSILELRSALQRLILSHRHLHLGQVSYSLNLSERLVLRSS